MLFATPSIYCNARYYAALDCVSRSIVFAFNRRIGRREIVFCHPLPSVILAKARIHPRYRRGLGSCLRRNDKPERSLCHACVGRHPANSSSLWIISSTFSPINAMGRYMSVSPTIWNGGFMNIEQLLWKDLQRNMASISWFGMNQLRIFYLP